MNLSRGRITVSAKDAPKRGALQKGGRAKSWGSIAEVCAYLRVCLRVESHTRGDGVCVTSTATMSAAPPPTRRAENHSIRAWPKKRLSLRGLNYLPPKIRKALSVRRWQEFKLHTR